MGTTARRRTAAVRSLKHHKARGIDEYLARIPDPAQRAALVHLRAAIHSVAPGIEEYVYYHLPAFRLNGSRLVCFGVATHHCSLYPLTSTLIDEFAKELKGFETSRGTIRFQPEKPIPIALVRKIVRARIRDNEERKAAAVARRRVASKARAKKTSKKTARKASRETPVRRTR